ncbi:MAG TPA: M50 family metallopeptidase, partial [Myxococcota bacterium]
MFRLLSVKQIPVAAHWSLLLAVGLFAWRSGSFAVGAVVAVLLFGSVLLHELGHALVAVRFGLPITGIDLHLFGGTAKMGEAPRSPREELIVAVAGPAVSLLLAIAAA